MKIIDLLNKIASGEQLPEKIYCFNEKFYLKGNTYFGDTFTLMHYIQEEDLNETVEIIEEEKKHQELDQYKNNWEELKKWLNEEYDHYDKYGSAPTGCAMGEIKRTLNKMKELEEDK